MLTGGYFIRNSLERAATLEFLRTVNRLIQWTTDHLITSLSEQWSEFDGD